MKFDVVLGNPPYQDPEGAKNIKIWLSFFELCIDLLIDGGHMSYVTPTTHFWGLGRPWQTGRCAEILLQKCNIKRVDFTTSKHFPQVGDYICNYALTKEAPTTDLVPVTEPAGNLVLLAHDDIYDCDEERKKANFFREMRKLRDKYGKYNIPHDSRDATHYSLTQEGKYQHPTYVSAAAPIKFADSPTRGTGELKIILNMSSYFWNANNTEKYMRLDSGPGVGLLGRMIAVKDEEEGRVIMNYLQSRVVKFYIACMKRTSPWNHAMYQLPKCHHLSEQELLDEIGISKVQFDEMYPEKLDVKV